MTSVGYKPRTSDIPTDPGVYVFRDAAQRVLYVGKAKNLRNRLSSYFGKLESLADRTQRMVTSASSVTWTVVNSEREALQLEFTWIKEYSPPFNIQFRDDKSYPYLAFTGTDEFARVYITRNRRSKKDTYFGPFTKAWALRETLDHLLPVFPVRSCSDGIFARAHRAQRPCLLGDIGRCSAPCAGRITPEKHAQLVRDFGSFMAGRNDAYVKILRQQMTEASQEQDYERAARLRDNIAALEAVLEKSAVVLSTRTDIDVVGIARDELSAAVQLFHVRGGRIRGVQSWNVDTELNVEDQELVTNALRVAYEANNIPPAVVCVPSLPDEKPELEQWLSEVATTSRSEARTHRVELRTPQRGELSVLARTVAHNAEQSLALYKLKRGADYTARSQALTQLQQALDLAEPLLRIECFDISHLSGQDVVGSMVVFEDGLPKKSQYKKFKIQGTSDDTASLTQVLTRRAKYLKKSDEGDDPFSSERQATQVESFTYAPSLFVVDGGLPQVNAAAQALTRAGVENIPVIGLAKRLEEVWLPNQEFPLILARESQALYLLQHLRDESHRVAISFNRKLRSRSHSSVLSEIPGLGPKRVTALLTRFKSVAQIRQASIDSLAETPGINSELAQEISDFLNK